MAPKFAVFIGETLDVNGFPLAGTHTVEVFDTAAFTDLVNDTPYVAFAIDEPSDPFTPVAPPAGLLTLVNTYGPDTTSNSYFSNEVTVTDADLGAGAGPVIICTAFNLAQSGPQPTLTVAGIAATPIAFAADYSANRSNNFIFWEVDTQAAIGDLVFNSNGTIMRVAPNFYVYRASGPVVVHDTRPNVFGSGANLSDVIDTVVGGALIMLARRQGDAPLSIGTWTDMTNIATVSSLGASGGTSEVLSQVAHDLNTITEANRAVVFATGGLGTTVYGVSFAPAP